MIQTLKDSRGNTLGTIKSIGRRENIYDNTGNRLGYFDGVHTFDVYSNLIGEGNLLALLLRI